MKMNTWNEEEVNGQVIGTYMITGQLICNGRNQGQKIYAETEEEVKIKALSYIEEKKAECGEVFSIIFPGNWELKIFN